MTPRLERANIWAARPQLALPLLNSLQMDLRIVIGVTQLEAKPSQDYSTDTMNQTTNHLNHPYQPQHLIPLHLP